MVRGGDTNRRGLFGELDGARVIARVHGGGGFIEKTTATRFVRGDLGEGDARRKHPDER